MLGEHGALNLCGLSNLAKVRLPLQFLVEAQPENEFCITDLELALPPSVKHLTVWADMDSVKYWGRPAISLLAAGPPPTSYVPYVPRQLALEFMGFVSGLLTDHFRHLKEATYCYGDQALDTTCQCIADTLCSRCVALQILDLHVSDESSTQMQILSSNCQSRGVCLRTLQEQFED